MKITNNDQNLKQVFKFEEAIISVKRPWLKWLKVEKLKIPTRVYSNPNRDKLTTVALEGLGSLDFIMEFDADLPKSNKFGVGWTTTVIIPMIGRIRRLERPFKHHSFW